LNSTTL